jgi:hypothetical protein
MDAPLGAPLPSFAREELPKADPDASNHRRRSVGFGRAIAAVTGITQHIASTTRRKDATIE